jgi:hypothetical protein
MSQENVELARQYFEALNAHGALDFERTEHFRHPEIELQDPRTFRTPTDMWVRRRSGKESGALQRSDGTGSW